MRTTLYVRLPHRPHDQPQPWQPGPLPFALVSHAAADRGRRVGAARPASTAGVQLLREGHAAVADLPAADRLVLIVAASDVLLTSAAVPPLAPARLRLALPNLVEDALASDTGPCHIAVGPVLDSDAPRAGPRRRLLMVADRAWLRAVLDAFATHRHRARHVLPAQLCVPLAGPVDTEAGPVQPAALVVEADTTLLAAEPLLDTTAAPAPAAGTHRWHVTVRTGPHAGYGLLLGHDALAAWQALAPAGLWYGDRDALAQAPVPALRTEPRSPGWPLWIEGAQACLRDPSLNLAQFEFAQGRADRWNLRAWRLPLALAAALLLVQILGMNLHWLLLRNEARHLEASQLQVLHTAFPQVPVVIEPPLQMRRQVEQLRLASGRSTPDDFLPLADRFAQAAGFLAPDALQGLEYRSRTLFVTLKPGTDTARLASSARQAGLNMEEDRSPPEPGAAARPSGSRWAVKPGL